MSLLDNPSFKNISTPIRSASLPTEAYVLYLASLPSYYAAASSAPTNAIHLFDKSRLQVTQTLPGHESSITALRSVPNFANAASQVLVSCGKDGAVKAWDERAGVIGLHMTALTSGASRALLSCDVSADGMTIAAGTELKGDDALILYWDPRNPAAPLRAHSSTHSDDITALHFFRPSSSSILIAGNVLLSASSDGLVCTSNADEQDEDEAGIHVGNWGCSVAQAGWVYGRTGPPGVWASSDMETFSVWSSEFDQIQDIDIRQPSIHRQDMTWVTDYLIGCHNNSSFAADSDNDLSVFAGSNEGDVALLSRSTFSDPSAPWLLQHTWTTGHSGVVRSVLWDERNNVLLTGGEDSRLNVWSSPTSFPLSSPGVESGSKRSNGEYPIDVDGDGDVPMRKKRRA